ncbi:retrovirus-related pol polyprotein from transposon TNT 1-94 [Tanacetum coccineum]
MLCAYDCYVNDMILIELACGSYVVMLMISEVLLRALADLKGIQLLESSRYTRPRKTLKAKWKSTRKDLWQKVENPPNGCEVGVSKWTSRKRSLRRATIGICCLRDISFRKCINEYARYVKFANESILLACLYMDDLIFIENSPSMINELKKSMTREFDMTNIGLMSYYLGIDVKQMDEGIFICQERYAKEKLKRFDMDKCNPVGTPIEHKEKSSKHGGGKAEDLTLFKSRCNFALFDM